MAADLTKPIRGRQKLELMHDLAAREMTHEELAQKYDRAVATIAGFATRHKAEIQEIRANVNDEFAGLWITKRKNRLAEYQSVAEKAEELVEQVDPEKASPLLKVKTHALRSAAEELGQLNPKNADDTTHVTVHLEGIDLEKLR